MTDLEHLHSSALIDFQYCSVGSYTALRKTWLQSWRSCLMVHWKRPSLMVWVICMKDSQLWNAGQLNSSLTLVWKDVFYQNKLACFLLNAWLCVCEEAVAALVALLAILCLCTLCTSGGLEVISTRWPNIHVQVELLKCLAISSTDKLNTLTSCVSFKTFWPYRECCRYLSLGLMIDITLESIN